jgi:hypothetical protein
LVAVAAEVGGDRRANNELIDARDTNVGSR